MAQQGNAQGLSGRALALARRKAMSGAGKAALKPSIQAAAPAAAPAPALSAGAARAATYTAPSNAGAASGRSASLARRQAMSRRGKVAVASSDRVRSVPDKAQATAVSVAPGTSVPETTGCGCGCNGSTKREQNTKPGGAATAAARPAARSKVRGPRRPEAAANPGRAASLARRRAQSSRGKAGMSASGMSAAQTARATNPGLSGRELARVLRDQRSRKGSAGQKKSEPTGRQRPVRGNRPGGAQDAAWKVGASETSHGQTVTGTMVGRSPSVTGDEPSTCRAVTGTEYMGADIFRAFCQAEPGKGVRRTGRSSTSRGNRVTGNEVGRSGRVTGDEPGTCKRVTGTEYVGAEQTEAFCGTRPEAAPIRVSGTETRKGKSVTGNNVGRSGRVTGDEAGADRELTGTQYMKRGDGGAPAKVGTSTTLRGGGVTGTAIGRSDRVTGDEPGSCRNITGDDYIGLEQYRDFCPSTPAPQDRKVGASQTLRGETVTGTMTGRSGRVTGDEPGTCKAITGTPYAGMEQYRGYCGNDDTTLAAARVQRPRTLAGASMTGLQPGIGGRATGDSRGACEPVSGTPYVGADQFAAACPATAAEPGSPDFPQPLGELPWGQFSVAAPAHASQAVPSGASVTGTRFDQGQITGPFGMAAGKVTGTEEARFGQAARGPEAPASAAMTSPDGRIKSRVTGEGMDVGSKITGDDWERGDRVTGTEGASAKGRNPTRRGGPATGTMPAGGRKEQLPEPVSRVTGGSGNTDRGALVTYSGGARG